MISSQFVSSFVNPSKFYHVSDNGAWSSPRIIWSMPLYTSPPDPSPKVGGFVYSGMLQNAREYGNIFYGQTYTKRAYFAYPTTQK